MHIRLILLGLKFHKSIELTITQFAAADFSDNELTPLEVYF